MKRIEHILVLLATSLLVCGCPLYDWGHHDIVFVNKSGKRIGYQISYGEGSEITQDTIFICHMTTNRFLDIDSMVFLNTETHLHLNWETMLGDGSYFQLMVLDGEQFEKYFHSPCDVIRQNVPILYTYRLTLSDLEEMNWTVIFR